MTIGMASSSWLFSPPSAGMKDSFSETEKSESTKRPSEFLEARKAFFPGNMGHLDQRRVCLARSYSLDISVNISPR